MVCHRCNAIVKAELDKLGIPYLSVETGEVTIIKKLTLIQHQLLHSSLEQFGFELIDTRDTNLIEKLKRAIFDLKIYSDEDLKTSYSDFISIMINESFSSLNILFSEIEGITIEKYIIRQKIERVKELLGQSNLNISDIAARMHYKSITNLSSEFKSVTGLTPVQFRQHRNINYNKLALC